jgi:uncharacterized protein YwlG (UPF0340 family)
VTPDTKQVLVTELKQLMQTTSLDHSNIDKLAEAAHINRNTFLSLNRDVLDNLLYHHAAEMVDRVVMSIDPQTPRGLRAAFKHFEAPVEVKHITAQAGIDIGETSIGMHVQFVQVPVRPAPY